MDPNGHRAFPPLPHPVDAALPRAGLCARVGEQRAFELQCEHVRREMTAHLRETRGRRGLFVEYVGISKWGVGHTLSLAFALHHSCVYLGRYCYLRILDSELHNHWTYASGESWAPTPEELGTYASRTTIEARLSEVHHVVRRLRNESAPLIHLIISSPPPTDGENWLPWSLPLRSPHRGRSGAGHDGPRHAPLDRCFCRFVSQPALATPAAASRQLSSQSGVALHMRTGFADVMDWEVRALRSHAPRAARETRRWIGFACIESSLGGLGDATLLSDSPGLLAHAMAAFPRFNVAAANATATTRSWEAPAESRLAAALDVLIAGHATELHVSRYSSFMRPAVARSMCNRRVLPLGGAKSPCPRFDRTFVRNMHVLRSWAARWTCLKSQLDDGHPCKAVTARECRRSFIEGLG